jgi:ATP-dependent Clp protease ATP-binding subunit ClpC
MEPRILKIDPYLTPFKEELQKRIEAIGYQLEIDNDSKQFIALKGYDPQYGARPLKRVIQNLVEDAISELIISEQLQKEDIIRISFNKEEDKLDIMRV